MDSLLFYNFQHKVDNLEQIMDTYGSRLYQLNTQYDELDSCISAMQQHIQVELSKNTINDSILCSEINLSSISIARHQEDIDGIIETSKKYGIIVMILIVTCFVIFLLIFYQLIRKKTFQDSISAQVDVIASANLDSQNSVIRIAQQLAECEDMLLKDNHRISIDILNELSRMEQNLIHMDQSGKGVQNLLNRVQSIKSLFKRQGYEMTSLLGKPFNEGYNMIATMEYDDSLPTGEQIIKRVIKPQIVYKESLIQPAQVIVGYNE